MLSSRTLIWRRPAAAVSVVLLVALAGGCGQERRAASVLDAMPAGYDVYIAIDPDALGFEEIMETVSDLGVMPGGDRDAVGDHLGFDPLHWPGWVDFLGLEPGEDIGLLLDMDDSGEPELIALYLVTSDAAALEDRLLGLVPEGTGLEVGTSGRCAVLAIAPGVSAAADFIENLDSASLLGDDESYGEFAGHMGADSHDLLIWAQLPETEEVSRVMLGLRAEGSALRYDMVASVEGEEFSEMAPLLGAEGAGRRISYPAECFVVGSLLFDTGLLTELGEARMPPDARMGLAMLGFESLGELISVFSGEIGFGLTGLEDGVPSGMLAFGLSDAQRAIDLLETVSGFASMAGEGGPEIFDFHGGNAYRIEMDGLNAEMGIYGDALYLTLGVPLEGVASGHDLDGFIERTGIRPSRTDAAFVLAGDAGELSRLIDEADVSALLEDVDSFSATLGVRDGLLLHSGAIAMESGDPYARILELAGQLAAARMMPPSMQPVAPPGPGDPGDLAEAKTVDLTGGTKQGRI